MRRRVLLCLTLILAMSACNGDRVGTPIGSAAKPSNDISDATHPGDVASNPDFFFLPPMVKQPGTGAPWDVGAFNPNLRPTVEICDFGPTVSALPPLATCTGTTISYATEVSIADEHYKVNWTVPTSATKFYRISVKVGSTLLGYADVESGANGASLKSVDTQNFVPLVDGRTLPIKFRIERYALCDSPGDPTKPCTSTVVSLATGGTATDAAGTSGVTIPAQAAGAPDVTITVADCADLNPRVTDLPVYGVCKRITANPEITTLTNLATVFNCTVSAGSTGLTPAQAERLTMHQLDEYADTRGKVLLALPRRAACQQFASAPGTFRGMLADLTNGHISSAARQALSILAPRDLHAARFIDQGVGGLFSDLSDFQPALPSKMEIYAGNTQSAPPGTVLPILPTVKVTDLDNRPVQGARITFVTSDGGGVVGVPPSATSAGPCPIGETCASVTTDAYGFASASWTLRGQAGPNALRARGRGIGGADYNGPRTEVDPFQPIQTAHDAVDAGTVAVILKTGSVLFSATGQATVLIYGPSLFTALDELRPQNEQTLATAAGFAVTVWNAATWSTKTSADFAKFSAIVLPDENCVYDTGHLLTANNTKPIWSPVVTGRIVVVGTDPIYHQFDQTQALTLMTNGIKFAASDPNATGLYIALGCTYALTTAETPVSVLSQIGAFSVIGQSGLGQTVTISNAAHPVMTSITAAGLSNWHITAHEAFPMLSSYPLGFAPLATIYKSSTETNVAYIIARDTPAP